MTAPTESTGKEPTLQNGQRASAEVIQQQSNSSLSKSTTQATVAEPADGTTIDRLGDDVSSTSTNAGSVTVRDSQRDTTTTEVTAEDQQRLLDEYWQAVVRSAESTITDLSLFDLPTLYLPDLGVVLKPISSVDEVAIIVEPAVEQTPSDEPLEPEVALSAPSEPATPPSAEPTVPEPVSDDADEDRSTESDQPDSDNGSDTSDPDADPEIDTDADPDADPGPDTDANPEVDPDTDANPGVGPGPGTDPATQDPTVDEPADADDEVLDEASGEGASDDQPQSPDDVNVGGDSDPVSISFEAPRELVPTLEPIYPTTPDEICPAPSESPEPEPELGSEPESDPATEEITRSAHPKTPPEAEAAAPEPNDHASLPFGLADSRTDLEPTAPNEAENTAESTTDSTTTENPPVSTAPDTPDSDSEPDCETDDTDTDQNVEEPNSVDGRDGIETADPNSPVDTESCGLPEPAIGPIDAAPTESASGRIPSEPMPCTWRTERDGGSHGPAHAPDTGH